MLPPQAGVIDAFEFYSARETSMKNNAFQMDDCFSCLSKFPDAYYCSTADQQFEKDENMSEEFFVSLH